jgi:hypothetical protein
MLAYKKLEQIAAKEIVSLQDKMILPDSRGGVIAFTKYKISPDRRGFFVKPENQTGLHFHSRRNALSWCIADRIKNYSLARSIHSLDGKKFILENDISARKILAEKSNNQDFKEKVNTKLMSKILYLNQVKNELEKYVNLAKYWQTKGFRNETE